MNLKVSRSLILLCYCVFLAIEQGTACSGPETNDDLHRLGNTNFYVFQNAKRGNLGNWFEAKEMCEKVGLKLAKIDDLPTDVLVSRALEAFILPRGWIDNWYWLDAKFDRKLQTYVWQDTMEALNFSNFYYRPSRPKGYGDFFDIHGNYQNPPTVEHCLAQSMPHPFPKTTNPPQYDLPYSFHTSWWERPCHDRKKGNVLCESTDSACAESRDASVYTERSGSMYQDFWPISDRKYVVMWTAKTFEEAKDLCEKHEMSVYSPGDDDSCLSPNLKTWMPKVTSYSFWTDVKYSVEDRKFIYSDNGGEVPTERRNLTLRIKRGTQEESLEQTCVSVTWNFEDHPRNPNFCNCTVNTLASSPENCNNKIGVICQPSDSKERKCSLKYYEKAVNNEEGEEIIDEEEKRPKVEEFYPFDSNSEWPGGLTRSAYKQTGDSGKCLSGYRRVTEKDIYWGTEADFEKSNHKYDYLTRYWMKPEAGKSKLCRLSTVTYDETSKKLTREMTDEDCLRFIGFILCLNKTAAPIAQGGRRIVNPTKLTELESGNFAKNESQPILEWTSTSKGPDRNPHTLYTVQSQNAEPRLILKQGNFGNQSEGQGPAQNIRIIPQGRSGDENRRDIEMTSQSGHFEMGGRNPSNDGIQNVQSGNTHDQNLQRPRPVESQYETRQREPHNNDHQAMSQFAHTQSNDSTHYVQSQNAHGQNLIQSPVETQHGSQQSMEPYTGDHQPQSPFTHGQSNDITSNAQSHNTHGQNILQSPVGTQNGTQQYIEQQDNNQVQSSQFTPWKNKNVIHNTQSENTHDQHIRQSPVGTQYETHQREPQTMYRQDQSQFGQSHNALHNSQSQNTHGQATLQGLLGSQQDREPHNNDGQAQSSQFAQSQSNNVVQNAQSQITHGEPAMQNPTETQYKTQQQQNKDGQAQSHFTQWRGIENKGHNFQGQHWTQPYSSQYSGIKEESYRSLARSSSEEVTSSVSPIKTPQNPLTPKNEKLRHSHVAPKGRKAGTVLSIGHEEDTDTYPETKHSSKSEQDEHGGILRQSDSGESTASNISQLGQLKTKKKTKPAKAKGIAKPESVAPVAVVRKVPKKSIRE